LQTLATCKESIPDVCATKGTCDVEFLGDLFHADVAVVVGGYEFVDEEAVVQAKEAHEGVMSEGVREEGLGWKTREGEKGLVDYSFVFILFVAANNPVCGESFGY